MGQGEPKRWGSHRGEKLRVRQAEEIWVIDEKLLGGVDHGRSGMLFSAVPYPDEYGRGVLQNLCLSM